MKTRLIIIGVLTIFLVGCSREFNLKEREAYIPGNQRFLKEMNRESPQEYNDVEYAEKYNLPISKQVFYAYDSYQQIKICAGCILKLYLK